MLLLLLVVGGGSANVEVLGMDEPEHGASLMEQRHGELGQGMM